MAAEAEREAPGAAPLSVEDLEFADALGLPPTQEAVDEALDRLAGRYRLVCRLKQKYDLAPDTPGSDPGDLSVAPG